MIALAMEAPRSKDPIDHYVLSWKEGEQPTPEQCDDAVSILMDRLRLQGHQCRYALHNDTDNYHLHVLVNRVHPITEKVNHVEFPINRLHESLALVEHKQGWEREPNGIYVVNAEGEPARTVDDRDDAGHVSATARSIETRTGKKSAERIAIEEGAPIMSNVKNWRQLHAQLAERGIRFEQKGSGAILHIGEQIVKASVAGRDCSMSRLERRLGPYEAADTLDVADRKPEPVSADAPHWNEYAEARRKYFDNRKEQKAALAKKHQEGRVAMQKEHQQHRKELFDNCKWKRKGWLLYTQRSVIAAEQAASKADLKTQQQNERKNSKLGKFAAYEEWLQREYSHQEEPSGDTARPRPNRDTPFWLAPRRQTKTPGHSLLRADSGGEARSGDLPPTC